MTNKFISFDEALHHYLQDPEFEQEYYRTKPFADLAREIYRWRKHLGLTQAELAERSGTYQTRISKLETGDLDPRLSTLTRLAEALGTSLEIHLVVRPQRGTFATPEQAADALTQTALQFEAQALPTRPSVVSGWTPVTATSTLKVATTAHVC